MRNIKDLIAKKAKPPGPQKVSDDEFTHAMYLEDLARLRDFSPPASRMMWPSPIGPRWKN